MTFNIPFSEYLETKTNIFSKFVYFFFQSGAGVGEPSSSFCKAVQNSGLIAVPKSFRPNLISPLRLENRAHVGALCFKMCSGSYFFSGSEEASNYQQSSFPTQRILNMMDFERFVIKSCSFGCVFLSAGTEALARADLESLELEGKT